jgi:hypothetical protein
MKMANKPTLIDKTGVTACNDTVIQQCDSPGVSVSDQYMLAF